MTQLTHSVVLVTGANRGLGAAFVRQALARGARKVYATARHPLDYADDRVVALALDVTDEEAIRALAAKIRSALTYYREAAAAGDVEMRLHSCTLYASLFRYDDEIMVNPHAFGEAASADPVLHLRRLDGGQVAALYVDSFERVWDTAKPWHGEDV